MESFNIELDKLHSYITSLKDKALDSTMKLEIKNDALEYIERQIDILEDEIDKLRKDRDNNNKGRMRKPFKITLIMLMFLTISMANIFSFIYFYNNILDNINVSLQFLNAIGMLLSGGIITCIGNNFAKKFVGKCMVMYDNSVRKLTDYDNITKRIEYKSLELEQLNYTRKRLEREKTELVLKNAKYNGALSEINGLLSYLDIEDEEKKMQKDNSMKRVRKIN